VPLREISIAQPTPLATLIPSLPPVTWVAVIAKAGPTRFLELSTPSMSYPGAEVRLYLERGKLAIGVFRPVARDLPAAVARIASQPAASLVGIDSIDIITVLTSNDLIVEIGGREHRWSPDRGAGLTAGKHGWAFDDVLATLAPETSWKRLRLIGATEVGVERDDRRQVTVKLTHEGAYVFRMWEEGRAVIDVRALTRIVVE
jgi:hypothetical protein